MEKISIGSARENSLLLIAFLLDGSCVYDYDVSREIFLLYFFVQMKNLYNFFNVEMPERDGK